ncbi:MAG: M56 family metallopeptidase [Candidatus Aminicenantes bacterium]|nr:M56 family metallopeptidase [Candidatus Aminicenantes bacterium]
MINILNNVISAEWIINMAFQSLCILLIGWGIVRLLKSKSAPLKSALVLITMVLLLFLPLMNVSLSSLFHKSFGPTLSIKLESNSIEKSSQTPNSFFWTPPTSQIQNEGLPEDISRMTAKKTSLGLFWIHVINVFGLLWGIVSLLLFFRFLYGAFSLKKLRKGLTAVTNPQIETVFNELKSVFSHPIHTKIYESSQIRSPLVLGFFKPFILLPSESVKKMQQNDIRSVLTHELSHIYHRDQMIGILQRIITSLNWWNPLVFTISATLSRAREEISDNHVLLENNSKEYAECLINLAEDKSFIKRFSVANAMASSHLPLKERVNHILSKERNMETRLKKSTIGTLVLLSCALLVFIASYRMTFATEVDEDPRANLVEQEKQTEKEQAVRARGDIKPPKLIKSVKPDYPEEAKKEGIEGAVILEATTDQDGVVQKVEILRSIPALDQAAIDALKQWEFEPMLINGEPKGVIFTVTCRFSLEDEEKVVDEQGGIQNEIEQEILILEGDKIPKLLKKVDPVYPESARKEGINGEVIIQVTIDESGLVEKAQIIKSIPELDGATIEAVQQWTYEPYLVDNKPIKVSFNVPINFRLR